MSLTTREDSRIVPEYSLTGDILSYLRCPQQYRRYNLGRLPPSKPVQLWFGEFIHGVMEESYRQFKDSALTLPIKRTYWTDFKKRVVDLVVKSLMARGLQPYRTQYRLSPESLSHPPCASDYGIAAMRAFEAVNTWGFHLFPIINFAEVRLKGTRELRRKFCFRANHYQIQGVVDVVSTLDLENLPKANLLCEYLLNDERVKRAIGEREKEIRASEGFEIIIDYKGMRRPPKKKDGEVFDEWDHYLWQIRTYAWLREMMPEAKPVVVGVLLFLNELVPSREDFKYLQAEVLRRKYPDSSSIFETDIMPDKYDFKCIDLFKSLGKEPLPELSKQYRLDRSILITPISESPMLQSISEFDKVVEEIETCVKKEVDTGKVTENWGFIPERDTCVACDFNKICKKAITN
ncbi:MAG: PD-(D/E)XK nuclease family protein [Candidatus Hodarchaeota archaeon]